MIRRGLIAPTVWRNIENDRLAVPDLHDRIDAKLLDACQVVPT